MIFRDKVTGRNFLIPTGPPTTQDTGTFSEIEKLPVMNTPPENTMPPETFIGDPKPIIDVSEFLNIPPKPAIKDAYSAVAAYMPTVIAPDYNIPVMAHTVPNTSSNVIHSTKFEPISEDEEDEKDMAKVMKFEPISDEEPEEEQSPTKLPQVAVIPPRVVAPPLPPPLPPPPVVRTSRGKDLQRALQESHIEDISQSSQSEMEESDQEQGESDHESEEEERSEGDVVRENDEDEDDKLNVMKQKGKYLPNMLDQVSGGEEENGKEEKNTEEEKDEKGKACDKEAHSEEQSREGEVVEEVITFEQDMEAAPTDTNMSVEEVQQPSRRAKMQGLVNVKAMIGGAKSEQKNYVVEIEEQQCVMVNGQRRWKCLRCPKLYRYVPTALPCILAPVHLCENVLTFQG